MATREQILYDKLSRLVMTERELISHDYPREDPAIRGLCIPPTGRRLYELSFPIQIRRGFVHTRAKPELGADNKHGVYALDCEMCTSIYGYELTQVTLMDCCERIVYDKLVKPTNRVRSYNTEYSGIRESDLENVTMTLSDVQEELLELISDKTILIGHGLDSDLRALRMFHERVIDTVQLYPHRRGLPHKNRLKGLAWDELEMIIQTGIGGHDSKEDARAALRLALKKAK